MIEQIFGSKPENGFQSQPRSSPSYGITPMNASPYGVTQMSANNNSIYGRLPLQYDHNSTYAQIKGPTRSSSQDQLVGMTNPMGQHQYRRPLYQHSLSHQTHQMTTSYPPPPTLYNAQSIQSLPQQHYVQYPNGPNVQSIQRAVRPLPIYNQWNGPSNVVHPQPQQQQMHPQMIDNHKKESPTTSTSSGDSLLNSYSQSSQLNASPNTSPPNSYPNNKSYYSYRPQQLVSSPSMQNIPINFRKVRTRYACVGENDSELSFEPNMIITNGLYFEICLTIKLIVFYYAVRPSREPGWLEGCLNGKTGLIPENYVEYID